jgi:hypothetical protein
MSPTLVTATPKASFATRENGKPADRDLIFAYDWSRRRRQSPKAACGIGWTRAAYLDRRGGGALQVEDEDGPCKLVLPVGPHRDIRHAIAVHCHPGHAASSRRCFYDRSDPVGPTVAQRADRGAEVVVLHERAREARLVLGDLDRRGHGRLQVGLHVQQVHGTCEPQARFRSLECLPRKQMRCGRPPHPRSWRLRHHRWPPPESPLPRPRSRP